MKFRTIATLFIIFFSCIGKTSAADYVHLPGVVHVHSTFSSGLYSMEELVAMARKSGLEVMVMTDHDLVVMEYGIFPFRNLLKKRVERNSVLKLGPEKYLSAISQINQRQKEVLVVPGVQSSPFYYWTGSLFNGNLTSHDYRKELLLIGMLSPEDYRNLPLLHRGFSTRYIKEHISQWIVLLMSLILGFYLYFQHGALRVIGILIGIFSTILLINHHPFQSSRFDPYHGDQGIAPYQELLDYVQNRGGLAFWAHPESSYSKRGQTMGPVKLMTMPHVDSLSESKDYTGFSAIYGDNSIVADPGKKWDQLLNEYCAGVRDRPVWGIGGADFHGEVGGVKLETFQTVFLARSKSTLDIIDAFAKGRVYAKLQASGKGLALDRFKVADTVSGRSAFMGEELDISEFPTITGKVSATDGDHYAVRVLIIKGGNVIKAVEGKTPLSFRFEDKEPWAGKAFYRLEVKGGSVGKLISNPIFINRKLKLSPSLENAVQRGEEKVGVKIKPTGKPFAPDSKIDSEESAGHQAMKEIIDSQEPDILPTATSEDTITQNLLDKALKQTAQGLPYAIQVASLPSLDHAEKALLQYEKIDLPSYFVKVDLGDKGIWWRLYIGCFNTRQAAMKAREVYNLPESIVQRTRYANLIGGISTEKELSSIYKRLKSLKYSPYLIKTSEEDIRLYVGAFISIKGARDLQLELKEKGIVTQVVNR